MHARRFLTCCSCLLISGAGYAEPIVHRGDNTDPSPGTPGVMPYEMAGRPEPAGSLCDFSDVTAWEVEGINAEGRLYRTRDQRLWSEYSGKLVYVGRGDKPVLNVRLRTPVPIADTADMFNWWNFGNCWGWVPDPQRPFLGTAILLRDAGGKDFALWPGAIDHAYWFMLSGRISAQQRGEFKRPYSFVGFQFHGLTNIEPNTIYLGPCYALAEPLQPLVFPDWPPEKLPFPTRPETILPTNKCKQFSNAVRRQGDAFVLGYAGEDTKLEYIYTPKDGTLGDIELRHGDRVLRPCAGGGLQLVGADGPIVPDAPEIERELKSCELADDAVRAVWTLQAGDRRTEATYVLKIQQKSLIIDIATDAPIVERVALGRVEPVRRPKSFRIPYLTFAPSAPDPHLLYADGLFLFSQFDWYVSDASKLIGGSEQGADWAVHNVAAQYIPKTDGTRNPVRERLFITASPDVQEVLPTIPNPPSPFKDVQGERLWRVKMGGSYDVELAEAHKLHALGCEKMTIRYHEDTWRDGGESFTFRLNAAPGRGGDEVLRQFVSDIKALDWRIGLYSNYTDFAPVNALWHPDHVIRLPNGDWQRAWMRCYAPKPMWGWQMQAEYAPKIHAKFGSNHSYCDVHTTFMPSEREDYDARVPGAATFRRTYECFGRLLYNEKFAYEGPVFSEGRNHWLYAGLVDGNYAQLAGASPSAEPLFVDFDLLKIHPLETDAGMGAPGMFFKKTQPDLDQFIATTLAYGHIGFAEWTTIDGVLKIYNMVQPAQKRYAMVPVERIEYESGGKLVDTSQALVSGAYLNNRVHVRYQNGTDVYVNGSDAPWPLDLSVPARRGAASSTLFPAARQVVLPKWGYVVTDEGGLVCASAVFPDLTGERRIDASFGDDRQYVDSRGGAVTVGDLTVEGGAILTKTAGDWWLIPAATLTRIRFAPERLGLGAGGPVQAAGFDADGTAGPAVPLEAVEGRLEFVPDGPPAIRYLLTGPAS